MSRRVASFGGIGCPANRKEREKRGNSQRDPAGERAVATLPRLGAFQGEPGSWANAKK